MSSEVATDEEPPPLTTMASAMFFGSILFTTVALACKSGLAAVSSNSSSDDDASATSPFSRLCKAAQSKRSYPLDGRSLVSLYTLFYHTSLFGLILLYAYLCEHHPPHAHAQKSYDRDEFFFLTAVLILVSLFTLKSHAAAAVVVTKTSSSVGENDSKKKSGKANGLLEGGKSNSDSSNGHAVQDDDYNKSYKATTTSSTSTTAAATVVAPSNDLTEVLNRDQTEEWKGWMQFMFLLYHYYHAEEVYNAIRIMITCYVFMTGFGNLSFFYLKADYSAVRVLQMLWRLNFLVIFLCLTQGTTYILYYICLLHTYFFLMVYLAMRIGKDVNYTKWGIRIKLFLLAVIIFIVWDVDSGIFRLLHLPFLQETHTMLGATSGSMWEWYFRSTLDHWSTFMGMIFALNFPITSLFYRKAEAQPLLKHVAAKSMVGAGFIVATYFWTTGPFQQGKFDYNQTNAYYGCIPVLAYIYFRNLTPWLRSHYLDLLHQIGKTTLETYLMQHHIWLTSNAKSLLTLIPGWPKMNFLVVSILYVAASRRLYHLTLFLRGMILPNDTYACLRNLAGMTVSISFFVLVAFILRLVSCLNLVSVAIVSIGFGYLLFTFVVNRTWTAFVAEGSSSSPSSSSPSSSSSTKEQGQAPMPRFLQGIPPFLGRTRLPIIVGVASVLVTGSVWHTMARTGATKIQPLPSTCQDFVQQGSWIPVDVCNEASRGEAYRDYDMAALGTCTPQSEIHVWGWQSTPASSHCRLAQRDARSLLNTIKHRNITFVGDSILRHMYHAMCRQVGDASAGAYNTTMEKWSNFSRHYGKETYLEFKWAPYTNDTLVDTLKLITEQVNAANGDTTPRLQQDLVIVGGGPWDLLHRYKTEEEKEALEVGVKNLVQQMEALRQVGVPIVWVVPTTINTWGLLTDLKRESIREDQLVPLRELYKKNGVHKAASFVLDGPSFTRDRVGESYDGVHYPLSVYDAGAQILANTFDWLLPVPTNPVVDPFTPPRPGSMANPFLGLVILLFVFVGLFLMDGFMGMSYLAAWFVPQLAPSALYDEAFTTLHQNKRLPPIPSSNDFPCFSSSSRPGQKMSIMESAGLDSTRSERIKSRVSDRGNISDDELEGFLSQSDDESPGKIAMVAT